MAFGIMANAGPVANSGPTRRTTFKVSYHGTYLGLTDKVDPSKYKVIYDGIFTGSTGMKNKLGDRTAGVDGVVSVQFRQVGLAMYQALCPWSNQSNGSVQLSPPLGVDLYTYSGALLLHPDDMPDTSEDITFPNACPISLPLPSRDGAKDDVLDIDFAIYLPRAAFNTSSGVQIFSGQIGPTGS